LGLVQPETAMSAIQLTANLVAWLPESKGPTPKRNPPPGNNAREYLVNSHG
jgi:hypothetical protein